MGQKAPSCLGGGHPFPAPLPHLISSSLSRLITSLCTSSVHFLSGSSEYPLEGLVLQVRDQGTYGVLALAAAKTQLYTLSQRLSVQGVSTSKSPTPTATVTCLESPYYSRANYSPFSLPETVSADETDELVFSVVEKRRWVGFGRPGERGNCDKEEGRKEGRKERRLRGSGGESQSNPFFPFPSHPSYPSDALSLSLSLSLSLPVSSALPLFVPLPFSTLSHVALAGLQSQILQGRYRPRPRACAADKTTARGARAALGGEAPF